MNDHVANGETMAPTQRDRGVRLRGGAAVPLLLLLLLLPLLAAPGHAEARQRPIELHTPRQVERGVPFKVHLWPAEGVEALSTALLRANGDEVTASGGYLTRVMRDVPVWVSLLGVPSTLAPGDYRLQVGVTYSDGGTQTFERDIEVTPRDFASMRIALNQAMSDLRETADPRRVQQARETIAPVARYNDSAIYNEGSFIVPVEDARISAGFGDRRVFDYADGAEAQSIHFGIDLAAPTGTPVFASGAGRVAFAADRIITGYTVVIEYLPGVFGLYYHLDRLDVQQGDLVRRGQQIGTVGMTGLATGPHLHWEFRVGGVPVDPAAFVGGPLVDKGLIFRRIGTTKAAETERG